VLLDERWREVRRLLVVRLDNLGDVLVTTPAIHALKQAMPRAEVTLLASPVGAQVGRLNPDLDEVLVYQAPWMDPWQELPHDSAREQEMIATLRAARFDAAVIFTSFRQSPLPAAYLCYLADIPLRLGATYDGAGSLLTTRHKHPDRMMHEVERGLDLVGAVGVPAPSDPGGLDLALSVPEGARDRAIDLLIAHGAMEEHPLVVLHPGCNMPARTYPWDMYVQVINRLVERLDATVLLTGAAGERSLLGRIHNGLEPRARRATTVFGGLKFAVFCALIEQADLAITNNTGPMHLAAAVKTPVVSLFALTNPPEQWGPWRVPHRQLYHDVACRICYSRVCPYGHECLRMVSPDTVVDAAEELLVRKPHLPAVMRGLQLIVGGL
jgi:ADP-heptose:LPS heptosyltransferase